METQNLLNTILMFFLLIVTICIAFVSYFFVQALKAITRMADNIEQTTDDIKSKLQMKALAAIPALLISLATKVIRRRR